MKLTQISVLKYKVMIFTIGLVLTALASSASFAQVKIQYPEYEWQVNLIPEVIGESPAYCVASNRYSDGTFMSFGAREDGKTSMALKFSRDYFRRSSSYPVMIGFSSGVEGTMTAFAKSPDTLIIQGGKNDVLWRQLEENDMFSYQVDDLTFVYSLDYFSFIRRNLDLCLEKSNLISEKGDVLDLNNLKPRKRFDLSNLNVFDDVKTGSGNELDEDGAPVKGPSSKRESLYERDYGTQSESVLEEVIEGTPQNVVVEKSDVLDRLFATFKDTEFNTETWANPDVPELPTNYIESGLDTLSAVRKKAPIAEEELEPIFPETKGTKNLEQRLQTQKAIATTDNRLDVSPSVAQGVVPAAPQASYNLPEIYYNLFDLATLLPLSPQSIQSFVSEDYISYTWPLPSGDQLFLEQILWPENFGFEDMMENYVQRISQDCVDGIDDLSDVYEFSSMDISQGNFVCGDNHMEMAFLGIEGNFTTLSISGNGMDQRRLRNARDRFLKALVNPNELAKEEVSSEDLGTIFPRNTLISNREVVSNATVRDRDFLPKSNMVLESIANRPDFASEEVPVQNSRASAVSKSSTQISLDDYLVK